jgi:hypothetical protein
LASYKESQAHAVWLSRKFCIEYLISVLWRNAAAIIGDGEFEALFYLGQANFDLSTLTVAVVTGQPIYTVVEQIGDDLSEV